MELNIEMNMRGGQMEVGPDGLGPDRDMDGVLLDGSGDQIGSTGR